MVLVKPQLVAFVVAFVASLFAVALVRLFAIFRFMRDPRPDHETEYVENLLSAPIAALKKERVLRGDFYLFAVKEAGADPALFPKRIETILRGRTPPTYVAFVIQEWWRQLDPSRKPPTA